MDKLVLDTIGKLYTDGHGMFGWCLGCGSPSQYWDDVRERRTPKRATYDIDLAALIRERGTDSPVVGMEPIQCPYCGSWKTETRITTPAKPRLTSRCCDLHMD
jgi:hypothetical protein